jgi:hypothetical protein
VEKLAFIKKETGVEASCDTIFDPVPLKKWLLGNIA